MPPLKGLSLKEKLKLLDSILIHSRDLGLDVVIYDGKVYAFTMLKIHLLVPDPDDLLIDKLCDDLFFMEFGVEPDDKTIEQMVKEEFDFGDTIN